VGVEEDLDEAAGMGVGEVAVGELRQSGGQDLRFLDLVEDEQVGLLFQVSRIGRLQRFGEEAE
jgi:hypothetical protein